jgi:hypothetical protein
VVVFLEETEDERIMHADDTERLVSVEASSLRSVLRLIEARSANERWKARWNTRLVWSITASVAAHALFLTLGSQILIDVPPLGIGRESPDEAWMSLIELQDEREMARSDATSIVVLADSFPTPDEGAADAGIEMTMAPSSSSLRERLMARGKPRPRVNRPERQRPAVSHANSSTQESTSARSVREGIPEPTSSMDFSRLSALRPDIALPEVSAWVLLQNRNEVIRFLQERLSPERLGPGVSGSVVVVLFIDERGVVEWAETSGSSRVPYIDEVVMSLFNNVVGFRPAQSEGGPVPRSAIFSVPYPWLP